MKNYPLYWYTSYQTHRLGSPSKVISTLPPIPSPFFHGYFPFYTFLLIWCGTVLGFMAAERPLTSAWDSPLSLLQPGAITSPITKEPPEPERATQKDCLDYGEAVLL